MTKEQRRALSDAIQDIQWMSGSSDFSIGGKAYKGWIKVRLRLERYRRVLRKALEDASTTRS